MGFVAVKCPSCGADVQLDDSREFGFCTFCGAKVVQDKIVVEHRGTVHIEGTVTADTLLERGKLLLKDGDFVNADMYFDRVLDRNPRCADAYWGRELCSVRISTEEMLASYKRSIKNDDFYLKAVEFSDGETQLRYMELGNKTEENQLRQETAQKIEAYKTARRHVITCYSIIVSICTILFFFVEFFHKSPDQSFILSLLIAVLSSALSSVIPSAIATPFLIKHFKIMRKNKIEFLLRNSKNIQ